MSPITGVYTALVTPFTRDGAVDWGAFDKLLHRQAQAEIDGVVISGTTGEAPTLTVDEKISLFRRARAQLPSQVKVMAGTGGNCTRQSVELSKLAQDAGVDSLLVVTPPYNKPSREGLRAHFAAIGQAVRLPICLYHVPSRTGQRLSAEDIAFLCEEPAVTAVKEASGELPLFAKTSELTSARLLSGDDFTFLPSLAVGGQGVISVVTNVFPKAFVQLYRHVQASRQTEALAVHRALLPFIEQLFSEASPGPVKAALAHAGLLTNILRLPMVSVLPETHARVTSTFERTQQRLQELGVPS